MGEELSERLYVRVGERFGDILCKTFSKMLEPNMLQAIFKYDSREIEFVAASES